MAPIWISLAIAGVLVASLLISAIAIYNGLIQLKNNIDKAWSNIDVLLKQRYDEIPRLVEICRAYMQHERETLEAVVKARSRANRGGADPTDANAGAQTAMSMALFSLFAVSENYPELKADQSFLRLQLRITELENAIADRREFYNESVTLYNTRIEQFPDTLIARPFTFSARQLWKIPNNAERLSPAVHIARR